MITITFDDQGKKSVYTLSDDVLTSLEAYRLTITQFDSETGTWVPKAAKLADLFTVMVIVPALEMFPTPTLTTAKARIETAKAAYDAAQQAELNGIGI